jgi:tRNA(Ile)-lysidine synthase TilS/MesJ
LIRGIYMVKEIKYSKWKDDHKSILESFYHKKILFGFSGGRDSSLALDFMQRAKKDFGFDFETHTGVFPIHRYPKAEKERMGAYWSARDVDIIWHDFIDTDDMIRNSDNPCHSCQMIRKKLLKNLVMQKIDNIENLVLIVNYTLWDIVGYSLEHILSDIFSDLDKKRNIGKNKRYRETAQRFYPLLKMKEGYAVFRPIIRFNGCDILYTIEKKGIPILSIPCDFEEYRPKTVLERYYEKMGFRFDYNNVFDFAKKALGLPDVSEYVSIDKGKYLKELF